MSKSTNKITSSISRKGSLEPHENVEIHGSDFCTMDNLEESLSVLFEELDCLDTAPIMTNGEDFRSTDSLKSVLSSLVNSSWRLVRKHRSLMKAQDDRNDRYSRLINDNNNLKNLAKRLKDDVHKKEQVIYQTQEREKRLKEKCDNTLRDLKRETDEILKLKKQLQSKDIQHEHEMRRAAQNEQKLREQLHKTIGTHASTDKALQNVCIHQHEKEIRLYKQTVRRLEENNKLMMHEINELKEALALSTGGIDLQIEASGIWTDVET